MLDKSHRFGPDHPQPRGLLHFISVFLLCGIMFGYLGFWIAGNRGLLFDPKLQNNDVCTHLIGFHRYTHEKNLADDPIAGERLATVPPGLRLVYRLFVPITGIYAASKIVQSICFLGIILAGMVLILSKRGSLAAGSLLVFFVFHSPSMLIGMAGGLPRNFFIPLSLLWASGAIVKNRWIRYVSIAGAALTYPPAMALLLGAEGFLMVRDVFCSSLKIFVGQLKPFVILVLTCGILISPYYFSTHKRDHLHSLNEAKQDPTFSRQGRVPALPFPEPVPEFAAHFALPFLPGMKQIRPKLAKESHEIDPVIVLIVVSVLAFLVYNRFSPFPGVALSIFLGSVSIYIVARILAFSLYWPYRYYQFGMPAVAAVLCVQCLGLSIPCVKAPSQGTIRNIVAILGVIVLLVFSGSGIRPGIGADIDGRKMKNLYAFLRTLPREVRIACHPMDGSEIPYWTGRATTYSFETLQPWFVESWKSQKSQVEDTLRALYAKEKEAVLSYCHEYGITHLFLRTSRYSNGFKKRARLLEPFGSFTEELLADVRWKDLVFARIPRQAVVYREGEYVLVEVKLLSEY